MALSKANAKAKKKGRKKVKDGKNIFNRKLSERSVVGSKLPYLGYILMKQVITGGLQHLIMALINAHQAGELEVALKEEEKKTKEDKKAETNKFKEKGEDGKIDDSSAMEAATPGPSGTPHSCASRALGRARSLGTI